MNKKGFTFTELVVVLSVIGILFVLAYPNIKNTFGKKIGEELKEKGFLEKYELEWISNQDKNIKGKLQGSFFLASGNLNGEINTENTVFFSWRKGREIHIMGFPYSKITFCIDKELENKKFVRFIFKKEFTMLSTKLVALGNSSSVVSDKNVERVEITLSEKEMKEKFY